MRMLAETNFHGRLTADADTRYKKNGAPVVNMRLAIGRDFKDPVTGEWVKITVFQNARAMAPEVVKRAGGLKKGDMVHIVAEMEPDNWVDPLGVKREDMYHKIRTIVLVTLPKPDKDGPPQWDPRQGPED